MKEYNKPVLLEEEIILEDIIALSNNGTLSDFLPDEAFPGGNV